MSKSPAKKNSKELNRHQNKQGSPQKGHKGPGGQQGGPQKVQQRGSQKVQQGRNNKGHSPHASKQVKGEGMKGH